MEAFGTTAQPFLAWLLETTLVASVVICLILVLQKLLGRRLGPRWSHALWLVLLLRMVLPWTPPSPVSLFSLVPASLQPDAVRETTGSIPREDALRPVDNAGTAEGTTALALAQAESSTEPARLRPHDIVRTASPSPPLLVSIRRMLPVFWLAGAILLAGYLVMSNFALWRIIKREHPLVKQPILELFEQCKSQMGVETIVALVPSDQVSTAALFGFVRPRLLLPREMIDAASPEELRYIFLHELAHLKRHDIYIGWLTSLLQVLHWFNPLVWLAFYRMRSDRELACDALVLTRTKAEESHDYGRTMVGLLGRFSRSRPLPAMAGILESKSQLKRRIAMIAGFKKDTYQWSPAAMVLIVALVCVSLMNAEQVSRPRQSANDARTDSASTDNLIVDSNSGLRFEKVCGVTSSGEVVKYKRSADLSTDGRFFRYGGHVIHRIQEEDLREVVGFPACRPSWSPDNTMMAFYADGIWVLPLNPETGEPTGPARKLIEGNYWYGPKVEWSPDSEKIVYMSVRDNSHLHVLSVKDGVDTQIADTANVTTPSWSPDGRWIAYTRWNECIWLTPTNGGESRNLVSIVGRVEPHWSPDGEWIFYQGRGRLNFIRVSDGRTAEVPLPKDVGGYLCWLPNGKMLFHRDPYEWRDSLRMVSSSGGESIKPDAWSAGNPYWTPDGRFVFTWGQYQDRWIYWVVPFAGGEPYPLKLEVPYGYVPGHGRALESLSPSKKKLFFGTYKDSTQPEYCVVPISAKKGTSTGPAIRVFDKAPVEGICWSPDESKLALICAGEIWIAETDGSAPTKFAGNSEGEVVRHAWSPDGNAISWISHDQTSNRSILRVRKLSEDEPRDVVASSKRIRHRWSPNGAWIYYDLVKEDPGATWEFFVTPASGRESKRLMEMPYGEHHKAFGYDWCSDGERLALLADRTLCILDVPIGSRQQIGGLLDPIWGRCFDMQWSPDGKTLGLILEAKPETTGPTDDISGNTRLFTVTVPEGKWTELGGQEGTNYHLAWSPDGKWIAYNSEEWIRTRAESAVWEVEVDTFLKQATGEDAASKAAAIKPEPALRRIEVRSAGRVHSRPSPDGRYLSGVDDAGNLIMHELATGKQWKLTKPESKGFAHGSLISPDSARVAYYWFNAETEDFDLRMVGLDGSNDRLLWAAEDGARSFNMRVWAPDGKHIFGEFLSDDEPARLIRVSADDGSREVVKAFDRTRFFTVDISPDGRYLAYDVADDEASNRDILVLDLEGNGEMPPVTHPANDKLLGWTPDGRHIFFASDRNGTWDGWLLRVDDGKPRGLPEMIKAGLGDVSPVEFTRSGSFYYQFRHQGWNVYVARLDPGTGEVLSEPGPVRLVGKDMWPDWSPDGQYLAYCAEPDRNKAQIIRIRTLATGQERELKPDLARFHYVRWCPDSRHLLITNFGRESPSVVYRLDAATGEYTALVQSDQPRIRQAELSPDGKTLAYRIRGLGSMNRLMVRDMETGNEKELLQTPADGALALAPGSGWALSPDGKHVALSIREDAGKPFVLKIMSVESGECRTSDGEGIFQMAWTHDGRNLLVTKNVKELWRVSAEGGEPQKLLDWNEMIMGPRIHPDGRRVAFFSGGRVSELWVMKNFLPAAVARASR